MKGLHVGRRAASLVVILMMGSVELVGCRRDAKSESEAQRSDAQSIGGLPPDKAKLPLAKVGNKVITVGEFAGELAAQSPYVQTRFQSVERKKEFLDNMVRFELLAAEAKKRGYDKLPDVERRRKQLLVQMFLKQEIEDKIKLGDIGEAEISAYYKSHPSEYRQPEQVRASHIVVRDANKAARVLRQAVDVAADDEAFRRLVQQHSEDAATRQQGGDLHFFSRPAQRRADEPAIPAKVAEAAFAIERIGGVHPQLVQSPEGYHIVRLVSRRAALARSLDEVRPVIQNQLWREKRQKAVADLIVRLRREAEIREDSAALRSVVVP